MRLQSVGVTSYMFSSFFFSAYNILLFKINVSVIDARVGMILPP